MRLLIALALLAFAAAPAAAASCPKQARCGSIRVALDHSGATPGTLPLNYAVLPATGPRTGAIVFLTGGPGESAVPYTDDVRRDLAPLRGAYDIVLVDQRGTGGSGAVKCESILVAELCGAALGKKRAFLSTAETARDVDDLRAALGLERITLLGVSYGTKVAGEYARRFPQRTAALVLDSPVGVDSFDSAGVSGIAAMPRVLREVCAGDPCTSTVKDAGNALFGAVRRVRSRSVSGPEVVSRRMVKTERVNELGVLITLQESDVDPVLRADLPAALTALARGDAAPFIHIRGRYRDATRPDAPSDDEDGEVYFSDARWLATTCLEAQLPWSPASAPETRDAALETYLAKLGKRPFAPFDPAVVWRRGGAALCALWPATPAPDPVPAAGPDVPVLLLSGREDLRTTTEDAQRTAAAYPHATVLEVPHLGHSVLTSDRSSCALSGVTAFLAGRSPAACETDPQFPAGPYRPASLRDPRTAVRFTVEGVRHDLEAARLMFGSRAHYELYGLRGGYTLVNRGRLELRQVEWFRGKRVSGTLSAAGNGTLTINKRLTFVVRHFAPQERRPASSVST